MQARRRERPRCFRHKARWSGSARGFRVWSAAARSARRGSPAAISRRASATGAARSIAPTASLWWSRPRRSARSTGTAPPPARSPADRHPCARESACLHRQRALPGISDRSGRCRLSAASGPRHWHRPAAGCPCGRALRATAFAARPGAAGMPCRAGPAQTARRRQQRAIRPRQCRPCRAALRHLHGRGHQSPACTCMKPVAVRAESSGRYMSSTVAAGSE